MLSAVKLQAVDDLVDDLALGAQRNTHQIELGARNRLHHLAVRGIVAGLEHVLGVDRRHHAARQRAVERARQRGTVGAIDQDRLADQPQVFRARAVFIGLADAFRICRGDAAGEERRDVELLPGFEIGADDDGDLGVELQGFTPT